MVPGGVSIFVATVPVDLRWSFDILAGLVTEQLRGDPRAGDLFVFHNRARTRLKILFYDRSGYCLLYKRLDRGTFPLPVVIEPGASHVAITEEQLDLLLRGLDVEDQRPKPTTPRRKKPRVH
jgi:transposase